MFKNPRLRQLFAKFTRGSGKNALYGSRATDSADSAELNIWLSEYKSRHPGQPVNEDLIRAIWTHKQKEIQILEDHFIHVLEYFQNQENALLKDIEVLQKRYEVLESKMVTRHYIQRQAGG